MTPDKYKSITTKAAFAVAVVLLQAFVSRSFASQIFALPEELVGRWAGTLTQQDAVLPVSFDFKNKDGKPGGDFSSPTQGCLQYPLNTVTCVTSNIHFVLGGGMIFDGQLAGDTITGGFRNNGATGTFTLKRAQAETFPYKVEEVHFSNGNVTLAGTLCIPSKAGRYPAIIFNQGSGSESRWGTNRFWAGQFARAGIAALCYDKRGCGESTGSWKQADFNDLARDCLAALHMLQARSDIDPGEIGLYGHSQGGFIAPLIASQSPGIAFIIAADSFGGVAYEQDLARIRTLLTDEGYSSAESEKAMTFFNLFLKVLRTGQGWDQLEAALPLARKEKWFKDVAPSPRGNWIYSYYQKTCDYNSLAFWEKIRVPVLLIYGERDRSTPPNESIRNIEQALDKAGNGNYAAILLPKAVHNDTIEPESGEPFFWWHVAPGLSDLQIGWIRQQIAGMNQK